MTSEIQWLIEQRILYIKLSGELTLEDMHRDSEYAIPLLNEGVPPVRGIFDDEDVRKLPLSLNELSNTLKVFQHPGRAWPLAVGNSSRIGRMILSLITQFFRAQFQRFDS